MTKNIIDLYNHIEKDLNLKLNEFQKDLIKNLVEDKNIVVSHFPKNIGWKRIIELISEYKNL